MKSKSRKKASATGAKDKNALKRAEREAKAARDYAEAAIRTARDPMIILRTDLRLNTANEAFYKKFKVTPQQSEGRLIYELSNRQWNLPKLRTLLEDILPQNSFFNDFEITQDFPPIGRRTMLLNARRLDQEAGVPQMIFLAIEDITERKRAECELAEKARLLDLSNDAIMVRDRDDKITLWNKGAEKLYGWTVDEVSGKDLHSLMHTEFPKPLAQIRAQLRREGSYRGEVVQVARDGRRITSLCRWVLDSETQSILTSYTDITERTQTEKALRESEERFRTLADNMDQLAWICDALGSVTWYNQRWLDYTGMTFADMQGWNWKKVQHPDHLERVVKRVQLSSETGQIWEDTFPLRGRDGSYRWFLSRAVPIRDQQGNVACWFGTNTDVTELREAQEALANLGAIVKFSEDAIISKDLNGIITSWNRGAERLFGYTSHEAVGQPVTMLIPPDHPDEEPSILARIRAGQALEHHETVRCRKDGTLLDISLTVSPIRNNEGQIIGASRIARDISHRKRNEKALRRAQTLLADRAGQLERLVAERTARLQETIGELEHFSYTITHDMRAPLRAMQGFARLLLADSTNTLSNDSADYLRRIADSAQRMDSLIRDSLQYAKIVRERIPLTTVEPDPVLRGVIESYSSLQPPHTCVHILTPLPAVLANEAGLTQCFANLMVNAAKFVKPGTIPQIRIWAETRLQDTQQSNHPTTLESSPAAVVRFWFEDNGIGIPSEYRHRIFEMFQQLDKSYEGTGIGLALVRKTAHRMEGEVGVESNAGGGSRFWLDLKKADTQTQ